LFAAASCCRSRSIGCGWLLVSLAFPSLVQNAGLADDQTLHECFAAAEHGVLALTRSLAVRRVRWRRFWPFGVPARLKVRCLDAWRAFHLHRKPSNICVVLSKPSHCPLVIAREIARSAKAITWGFSCVARCAESDGALPIISCLLFKEQLQ
jgi:hypothetical protein